MLNKFCRKPLYEVTRTMARVAMGAEKCLRWFRCPLPD